MFLKFIHFPWRNFILHNEELMYLHIQITSYLRCACIQHACFFMDESKPSRELRPNLNPCPMPIDLSLVPSSSRHSGRCDHLIKGRSYI